MNVRTDAGLLSELTKQPTVVSLGRDERGIARSAIVLVGTDGEVRAFENECRHLPIPLSMSPDGVTAPDGSHLICRTHGAVYQFDDGLCIEGPCKGLSLKPIEVRLEGPVGQQTVVLLVTSSLTSLRRPGEKPPAR